MNALVHAHSGLRWLVLISLLISIIVAFGNFSTNRSITRQQRIFYLSAMILFHIQFLLGVILYFMSAKVVFGEATMKETIFRFFTIEHPLGMLVAFLLITIGYRRFKTRSTPAGQHRTLFWFYLIAIIVILVSIPWPFREALIAGWY